MSAPVSTQASMCLGERRVLELKQSVSRMVRSGKRTSRRVTGAVVGGGGGDAVEEEQVGRRGGVEAAGEDLEKGGLWRRRWVRDATRWWWRGGDAPRGETGGRSGGRRDATRVPGRARVPAKPVKKQKAARLQEGASHLGVRLAGFLGMWPMWPLSPSRFQLD
uniref:Uncharacterized protein n=1 Tax=Oryza rufipogon TaxID=4529 RepID=A0A0E0Q0T3_ORYRU